MRRYLLKGLAAGFALGVAGCAGDVPTHPAAGQTPALEAQIEAFCGACHRPPAPEILRKEDWPAQIVRMYQVAAEESEILLHGAPEMAAAQRFFVDRAPEQFESIDSTARNGPGPARVARIPIPAPYGEPLPGVSNVQIDSVFGGTELVVTDFRGGANGGAVFVVRLDRQQVVKIADVTVPSHATVVDLDADGRRDVVVTNLGTVVPSDVATGSVEWVRNLGRGDFETITLASGLGRTTDAQPADFDGDGDLDLVVAVFGFRKLGEILLLENRSSGSSVKFVPRVLDTRPGPIHVPVLDLDGDGDTDFIAVVSQQFETIEAFVNRGDGTFDMHTLFEAEHPNWGSSGIELADVDADGDLDVLFANGDTLDDRIVKPYQGVQWLENRGGLNFEHHRLTDLYGAHFVDAGDLDADGDLDLVAASFLPWLDRTAPEAAQLESIVWLEQTDPGVFERHPLEVNAAWHPTLAVGDIDADGDDDVIAGNMTMAQRPDDTIDHWLVLFRNDS